LLKKNRFKVGVLSRGYGRTSHGYKLVSKGEDIFCSVEECGDEIYQTVLECRVPAAVSENRFKGAEKLITETSVNAIVLDDAFQHRWINRDVDLLIIDQSFVNSYSFFSHNLLPTGDLREGFSSIKRADAIILNRKFLAKEEISEETKEYFDGKQIFTAFYKAISFVDVMRKIEYSIDDFKGQDSLVFSGIANPKSFLNILQQAHVNTQNKLTFKQYLINKLNNAS
jgi:tetraacyldisaccharide 4'-kinase